MSHQDRVCMVNDMLRREGSFLMLFVFKEVNQDVEEAAQKLLDHFWKLKFEILDAKMARGIH